MGKIAERLKNGIITENPTFVQMLGMCQWTGYGTYNDGNPDDEQLYDLPAPEADSGQGAYSGLHRNHRFLCNNRTVFTAGIYSKPERQPGNLHSTDRCKLYHLR